MKQADTQRVSVTHSHSTGPLSSAERWMLLLFEAGQKTVRPRGRVVSGGEEGERMDVNNTSLLTPCGQGRSTIWPGGGRWLGTSPHHKSSLSLLDTGTWDMARCCRQAYKLFTEADQMSFKLLNMYQQTRVYQEQDRALAWSDYLFDTFTSMREAHSTSVGVLMHRRGLSLWIQLSKRWYAG